MLSLSHHSALPLLSATLADSSTEYSMPLFIVPLNELKRYVNPMDGVMWKCRPIDEAEVNAAITARIKESRSWNGVVNTMGEVESRQFHINRIATLVVRRIPE